MRIIYNTTFIVEEAIEEEWIAHIREYYLGSLSKLGLCDDAIFTKVSIDQPEGKTYSIQLVFHDEVQKEHFLSQYLPEIEAGIARRYANRYVCFNSILTEI